MSSQIGRNEPCPCGSGKKHKNCCYKKGVMASKKGQNKVALGVLGLVVVIAGIVSISKLSSSPTSQSGSPLVQPPITSSSATNPTQLPSTPVSGSPYTPQPPGPAPAGKIWSPEHGHWHDAPVTSPATAGVNRLPASSASTANSGESVFDITPNQLNTPSQTPGQLTPQPPGPAPAGKVWSAEHGHWHDAPIDGLTAGNAQPGKLTPQPPGPAPAGKVWSAEHGHWHDAPADAKVIQVNPTTTDPK